MLQMVVCSESQLKIRAVQAVVPRLGLGEVNLTWCGTDSGVPDQPIGMEQMLRGAHNRISFVAELRARNDYYIAIENGMVQVMNDYFDVPCVVVRHNPSKGKVRFAMAYGSFFPVPLHVAREVKQEGVELGLLVQRLSGQKEKDVVTYFSKSMVRREEIISQAVLCAFAHILNPDHYW